MASTPEVRCGCRKHAVTGLRCTRCDAPICPDCSKPAPVGFFCPACARGTKSALFQVSAGSFTAAAVAGLAASTFGGWILTSPSVALGALFTMVGGFFLGVGVGELVLRVTGRKRGLKMEIMAGAVAAAGIIIGGLINTHGHFSPQEVGLAAHYVFTPASLLLAGICGFGSFNRVRFL